MQELFIDALIDSLKMLPWLIAIYILIEWLEYRWGSQLRSHVLRAKKAGPAIGAALGVLPQCGFSVVSSYLYSDRLITLGTLLAVYLATSDEAIPIILSQPDKIHVLWPLLASKLLVGIVAGYGIDLVLRSPLRPDTSGHLETPGHVEAASCSSDNDPHSDHGCCHHTVAPGKPALLELVKHPLEHSVRVFAFLFLVSLIINYVIFRVGEENLGTLFLSRSLFQPVLASLIGLIPNCAASVVITEGYLKGALSFGSAIAGLSSGAGLGILVLARENPDRKNTAKVIALLLLISMAVGIAIQLVMG